jgi:uncharacterized protein (TIGR01777 family)
MAIHLVTGASGMVGKALIQQLKDAGHDVRVLTTRTPSRPEKAIYRWNPDLGELDPAALRGVEVVYHLAGATVSKPWTARHRAAILTSRELSTALLVSELGKLPLSDRPKTVVCASAVGIYPNQAAGTPLLDESHPPGTGFLADVVRSWETATDAFRSLGMRTVQLRIGIVLGHGGALEAMLPVFRMGLGSALGSGKQWMPWIHVDDVAAAFVFAGKTESMDGVYNTVSPHPATNRDFSAALAHALKRPFWFPAPPAWVLRLALGERSILLLGSTPTSVKKLEEAGFAFRFTKLDAALHPLFR